MSEDRERGGDGLLIGIIVVLVILVLGGLGLGLFGFRLARVEQERAIMTAEQARYQELQAGLQAEKAREAAEQAAQATVQSKSPTKEPEADQPETSNPPAPDGPSAEIK